MTTAAITIDVDSLRFYRAIHGRSDANDAATDDPIYTTALDRFFDLLEASRVPATLFLVGADAPRYAARFARAKPLGCEIASHSFDHDYRLSTRAPDVIADDLAKADAALEPLNGGPIVGFRAPGYNVTPALLEAVKARGHRYDSSLLPAPGYFAARAAAIATYAVRQRPSASLVGDPRQFAGPIDGPYPMNPDAAWRPVDGGALIELPMAVDPLTRSPLIGTTWTTLPSLLTRAWLRAAHKRLSCLVFEMHAIDLLDGSDHPDLASLAEDQRDVRVSVSEKMRRFGELFRFLGENRSVRTLASLV